MSFGLRALVRPSHPTSLLPTPDRQHLFAFAASLSRARLELTAEGHAALSAAGRTMLFRRSEVGVTVSSSCGWRFQGNTMELAVEAARLALDAAATSGDLPLGARAA